MHVRCSLRSFSVTVTSQIEPRKTVMMNLSAGQQWRHKRKETHEPSGGRRGQEEWREWRGNIYMTTCEIDASGSLLQDAGSSHRGPMVP